MFSVNDINFSFNSFYQHQRRLVQESKPVPRQDAFQDCLAKFVQACAQTGGYKELLENYILEQESAMADWYLFLIEEVSAQGKSSEYLKRRSTDQQISALEQLENDIKDFLAAQSDNISQIGIIP